MDIIKYLNNNKFDTVDRTFYSQIAVWYSWYRANVRRFHRYRVYRGAGCYVNCRRKSMGMAKKLCEDIADLLLNERVQITLADEKANAYVEDVLQKNNFGVLGNEYQERKAYCGTVAYVPYIRDMVVDGEGNVVDGAGIAINYVTAKDIYPLSWENGVITEVAFLFTSTFRNKKYGRLELHRQNEDKTYYIENRVFRLGKSDDGQELTEAEWREIGPYAGLAARVETGSTEPQFVIDKLNIVNNADDDVSNPMGVAIFANAIDYLQKLDLEFDSYSNEFTLGRKRIYVAPEMLTDQHGSMVFDPDDTVFYQLPEDYSRQLQKDPIKESNMQLRVEEHSKAINDDLNYLSMRVGFGTERYKFDNGNITTATQVISENSDMFRTIKKHELILDAALKQLVRIIIRLGNVLGAGLPEDTEITIDFDDSIIEDKTAERQSDRQEVSMGVMSRAEYRAKWYGETLEQAQRNLPEQESGVLL